MVNLQSSLSHLILAKHRNNDFSLLKLHILEHFCKSISPTSTLSILKSWKSCDTFSWNYFASSSSPKMTTSFFLRFICSACKLEISKKRAINLEVCSTFIFEITKPEFIWENMFSFRPDRKFDKSNIVKLQCICCLALNVVVNFISA